MKAILFPTHSSKNKFPERTGYATDYKSNHNISEQQMDMGYKKIV